MPCTIGEPSQSTKDLEFKQTQILRLLWEVHDGRRRGSDSSFPTRFSVALRGIIYVRKTYEDLSADVICKAEQILCYLLSELEENDIKRFMSLSSEARDWFAVHVSRDMNSIRNEHGSDISKSFIAAKMKEDRAGTKHMMLTLPTYFKLRLLPFSNRTTAEMINSHNIDLVKEWKRKYPDEKPEIQEIMGEIDDCYAGKGLYISCENEDLWLANWFERETLEEGREFNEVKVRNIEKFLDMGPDPYEYHKDWRWSPGYAENKDTYKGKNR